MLVQFSVENFKSIREEQTLSMVASNYEKDHPENVIKLNVPGMKGVNLLKSAVIYGANASGKSNLLNAIDFVRNFVDESAVSGKPGKLLTTESFLLDERTSERPSNFSITFVVNYTRHEYKLSVTKERVINESLVSYPKGQPVRIFQRQYDEKSGRDTYDFNKTYKISEDLQDKTRNNASFVSVGAQFNDEFLTPIYSWFSQHLVNISESDEHETSKYIFEDSNLKTRIINEIKMADFGIVDISIEQYNGIREFFKKSIKLEDELSNVYDTLVQELESIESKIKLKPTFFDVNFFHKTSKANISIPFKSDKESNGTLIYYSILGPIIKMKEQSSCGIFDEIDTSLHPTLVRKLVEMFQAPDALNSSSQLIFTTHDTSLLSSGLFRRDQIWFTEKRYEGDTVLYPLSDIQVRKGESLQKGYLAGRYGAIPYIPESSD